MARARGSALEKRRGTGVRRPLSLLALGLLCWDCDDATSSSQDIPPHSTSDVTLLAPNGGEVFRVGDVLTVRWSMSSDAIFQAAVVEISFDGGNKFYFTDDTAAISPADLEFEWTIPAEIWDSGIPGYVPVPSSSQCLVLIRDYNYLETADTSDAPFAIQAN